MHGGVRYHDKGRENVDSYALSIVASPCTDECWPKLRVRCGVCGGLLLVPSGASCESHDPLPRGNVGDAVGVVEVRKRVLVAHDNSPCEATRLSTIL